MTNSIVWLVLFYTESAPNITGSDTVSSYVGGQAGHSTVSRSSIWSDMATVPMHTYIHRIQDCDPGHNSKYSACWSDH